MTEKGDPLMDLVADTRRINRDRLAVGFVADALGFPAARDQDLALAELLCIGREIPRPGKVDTLARGHSVCDAAK